MKNWTWSYGRHVAVALIVGFVLLGGLAALLGGCAQISLSPADVTDPAAIDRLCARVKPLAAVAIDLAKLKLTPADQAKLRQVLVLVRAYVATEIDHAAIADAVVGKILNQVFPKADEGTITTVLNAIRNIFALAESYVTVPPKYQADAAVVFAYLAAGQRLLLAAIDGAVEALPAPNPGP
jgi:hypothetical protein